MNEILFAQASGYFCGLFSVALFFAIKEAINNYIDDKVRESARLHFKVKKK